jgi:hypothetical protein
LHAPRTGVIYICDGCALRMDCYGNACPATWNCVDCGRDTAPGCFGRKEVRALNEAKGLARALDIMMRISCAADLSLCEIYTACPPFRNINGLVCPTVQPP